VAGRNIRVGAGSVDVSASASAASLRTAVTVRTPGTHLLIGQVLPSGATVASVTLNGRSAPYEVRRTARGDEVVADAGSRGGQDTLVVTLR
jgi:hypothetical protein